MNGDPGRIRTCNLPLRRGLLYPVEPRGHSAIKIRHLRQFLRINSHGEDSLSTHDLSLNVCQFGPNVWEDVSKEWDDRRPLDVANSSNSFQTVSNLFRYNKWLPYEGYAWATPPVPVIYTLALTVRCAVGVLTNMVLLIYRGWSKTSE